MFDGKDLEIPVTVVTPTLRRPSEVEDLLANLSAQDYLPAEVILVDGAPEKEIATEEVVLRIRDSLPFKVVYVRHQGGTAVQRNAGIERAKGDLVAFVDDDVRLGPPFLRTIASVFAAHAGNGVGGVVGYRTNQWLDANNSERWKWYKRLRLFTVYEPGRYDSRCGYPINNNLQPPFSGTREVDFMTTACAVWKREVLESGLRFDSFFEDYGVLEDAHFSLRAGAKWKLLQCGDAHCEELHSSNGRVSPKKLGYKCVMNYYFVFQDIFGPLSLAQKLRFWRFQMFEAFRIAASAIRRASREDLMDLVGRAHAMFVILFFGVRSKTAS